MGLGVQHLVTPGVGAITLIAWVGVLGILGIALSVRQDIDRLPGTPAWRHGPMLVTRNLSQTRRLLNVTGMSST